MDFAPLRQAFDAQAQGSAAIGGAFTAAVIETVAQDLGGGGPYDALFASWLGRPVEAINADAAVLRLTAGFHDLVLAGSAPDLARCYPGHGGGAEPDRPRLSAALRAAAAAHQAHLARFMASPPQTNEPARSFCLFGGFLTVAKATGLPLRCLELGASGGLNQIWDRFRYDLGDGRGWGDPGSTVVLAGEWTGGAPPLEVVVQVAERRACDQAPVDLFDPVAARRLQAYVWPEQAERLARVRAAIALAQAAGVRVEAADAGDWVAAHAWPRAGVATVLYHSVFWQYPPPQTQARMAGDIDRAGGAATPEAPFAWLRMEPRIAPDLSYVFEVRLTVWPGGEARRLAVVHPHGAKVNWC